eukprot:7522531-Ditylum_brightwellii.AAC.1
MSVIGNASEVCAAPQQYYTILKSKYKVKPSAISIQQNPPSTTPVRDLNLVSWTLETQQNMPSIYHLPIWGN